MAEGFDRSLAPPVSTWSSRARGARAREGPRSVRSFVPLGVLPLANDFPR